MVTKAKGRSAPVNDIPVEDPDLSGLDEFAAEDKGYEGPDPVPLAEAAQTALQDIVGGEAAQPAFDGMENVTKVKFVGMAYDSVEDKIGLGDELVFRVRARCTAETRETLKDGLVRNVRKMDVLSVITEE